jgi:tRNA dimethylallyltransferase
VAEAAAQRFGASILSVDSMQVYRGMDIGTAKPSVATREQILHHMIDIADPADDFSVVEFQQEARERVSEVERSGGRIIIAGGSGLHFRSVVDPLTFGPTDADIRAELEDNSLNELQDILLDIDPGASEVVDVRNPRRVIRAIEIWRITSESPTERSGSAEAAAVRKYVPIIEHASIGLDAREKSAERVEVRFEMMISEGLVEEVRRLAPSLGRASGQALGYKEFLEVVTGRSGIASAASETIRGTKALVKRQRTFFGRDPRIEWIPWQDDEDERTAAAVQRVGEVAGWTS